MKTFLFLIAPCLIVIACCADNNEKPARESALNQPVRKEWLARRDSILSESNYHSSIYLTRDTLFKRYDWLLPSKILVDFNDNIEGHRSLTADLADTLGVKIRSFRLSDMIRNWAEIYLVGDQFCVYSPNDWMANAPKHITDSAVYTILSDQGYPELITGFRKRSSTQYELRLAGMYEKSVLTISVIDPENGIAVWEYRDGQGKVRERKLYVDARSVKRFPMVVCDCRGEKCAYGYDFKEPDFDSLLKTRSSSQK